MNANMSERSGVTVFHARGEEDAAADILADLRDSGLLVTPDPETSAALVFLASRATLADPSAAEALAAADARGQPALLVLLEPLTLPDDAPAGLAPLLEGRETLIAYDQPEEARRRGLISALAGLGAAGAGAGVAEAMSVGANAPAPASMTAASSSTAPLGRIDPLAKTNTSVIKASSTTSAKTLAFGGAAMATVLVVGAIVIFQGDPARPAAPAAPASAASSSVVTGGASTDVAAAPAEARPVPADIATGDARVTLAQDAYKVGYPIQVRVENMPGHENDYVAIARAGSPGYGEVRYEYMRGRTSADIVLRPVMEAGDYEVRLFFGNDLDRGKSDQIRYQIPLTITPADPITLTIDGEVVMEGRAIRVAFDGMPGNEKDWIATAAADSPDGSYLGYAYTAGHRAGSLVLPALATAGRYEIRVHFDDLTSDRTVHARIPVEVIPAPPVSLALDAESYAPGATIAVTYDAMPGNLKDWLSLARAGDDGYLGYTYTDGAVQGIATFRAPDDPGDYEIRAYFDDTTSDRTVRATAGFTVRRP